MESLSNNIMEHIAPEVREIRSCTIKKVRYKLCAKRYEYHALVVDPTGAEHTVIIPGGWYEANNRPAAGGKLIIHSDGGITYETEDQFELRQKSTL